MRYPLLEMVWFQHTQTRLLFLSLSLGSDCMWYCVWGRSTAHTAFCIFLFSFSFFLNFFLTEFINVFFLCLWFFSLCTLFLSSLNTGWFCQHTDLKHCLRFHLFTIMENLFTGVQMVWIPFGFSYNNCNPWKQINSARNKLLPHLNAIVTLIRISNKKIRLE